MGPVSLHHVHLVAEDKYKLARWYEEILGFTVVDDIEKLGEAEGPLLISADESNLSIFNKKSRHENYRVQCIPAFSLSPSHMIYLYDVLTNLGQEIRIYDHKLFYSFYIADPEGTTLEITSGDYRQTKEKLSEAKIEAWDYCPPE